MLSYQNQPALPSSAAPTTEMLTAASTAATATAQAEAMAATVPPSSAFPNPPVLATFTGSSNIDPIPLDWSATTAQQRGPIVVSRQPTTFAHRNAIGAYAGPYAIYRALAHSTGQLSANHKPDYTNTEPPFDINYNEAWSDPSKICSIDPWGHLIPQVFKAHIEAGIDMRPTASCTKAHLNLAEIDQAVRAGRLQVDGNIIRKGKPLPGAIPGADPGVQVSTSKIAVDPVWYLPGIADRLGIEEDHLRRSLFEHTGGMYPELVTRPDIKAFLPPIAGATVYIFGKVEQLRNPEAEVTVRVHDECGGSDCFGSDICTCRPYLIYGIEEAVRTAQRGGAGVVVYFRKEGRALGEVCKYLVYNARKRGVDSAANYFMRTENIAGVKDMRFQALMPDILHWLGIKKITNMISMSDMKYNAIVNSGIPIEKRYEIPQELIPEDSQVEIDAKIFAGYFSASKTFTKEQLEKTVGRNWEDEEH